VKCCLFTVLIKEYGNDAICESCVASSCGGRRPVFCFALRTKCCRCRASSSQVYGNSWAVHCVVQWDFGMYPTTACVTGRRPKRGLRRHGDSHCAAGDGLWYDRTTGR
jgi:hypothetical protein